MGPFAFEELDVFVMAVELARWAAAQSFPAHRKHLRDQLVRAADSIVLNLAEGSGHPPGDSRRHHYRIARGSAAEVVAVLRITDLPGAEDRLVQARRVGAMLAAMARG